MSESLKRNYDEKDICKTLEDVENRIFQWIIDMPYFGFLITKEHLINSLALQIKNSNVPNKFIDGQPNCQWFEGFLKKHPILTLSKTLVSEHFVRKWFQDIENYLKKANLLNIDSSRIYNTDDTSLTLNPNGGQVLARRGFKNVDNIVSNNEKQNITVLVTGNAGGQLAPTLVVFDYKEVPNSIYEKLPEGFCVGTSEEGYMTTFLFYDYIVNKFWPWLIENKIQMPVILFLDGNFMHFTQPLSEFCRVHQIVLIPLPPDTTHFLRPMDVSMFSTLKSHWKKKVNHYRIERENLSISKEDFAPILGTVFRELNLKGILSHGFRTCGLDPFSVYPINFTKVFNRKNTSNCQPVIRICSQSWLLETIEKYIGEATLRTFKCEKSEKWTGRKEDTSLFYLWRRICNDCRRSRNITMSTDSDNTHVESVLIPDVSNSQSDQDECIIGL
nr:uncharacterized protein LOC117219362 [Megalopta genalis]XP_033324362.1 uncharacterized protein LOC117219362 [Megalopta genalis]XP_033324363.1 uncharacterized protein LOC117219362 [Megalopta genalis]